MPEDNELAFLCDTLKKHHINVEATNKNNALSKMKNHVREIITGKSPANIPADSADETEILSRVIYKFTDQFGLSYTYFSIAENEENKILLIGPYMNERPSANRILEYAEKNSLSAKQRGYLREYYTGVRIIASDSLFFAMLNSFCERRWKTSSVDVIDLNDEHSSPVSPIGSTPKEENLDEILADMKAMENRYKYENELIDAVSRGQVEKENIFANSFSTTLFEKRISDPVRNAQNYCIIMNTLLRKAAESGGVHPIYIDRVSSNFALKIENLAFASATPQLMREIFATYSKLVRKHTMSGYSALIKNTVLLVDSDISAPLTPGTIAKSLGVSLGYLSALFKKETGKTLTDYITDKRIAHAKHLLSTTQIQVQTVALRCGILDVQYFSKLFKRKSGQTPTEYRERKAKSSH